MIYFHNLFEGKNKTEVKWRKSVNTLQIWSHWLVVTNVGGSDSNKINAQNIKSVKIVASWVSQLPNFVNLLFSESVVYLFSV